MGPTVLDTGGEETSEALLRDNLQQKGGGEREGSGEVREGTEMSGEKETDDVFNLEGMCLTNVVASGGRGVRNAYTSGPRSGSLEKAAVAVAGGGGRWGKWQEIVRRTCVGWVVRDTLPYVRDSRSTVARILRD